MASLALRALSVIRTLTLGWGRPWRWLVRGFAWSPWHSHRVHLDRMGIGDFYKASHPTPPPSSPPASCGCASSLSCDQPVTLLTPSSPIILRREQEESLSSPYVALLVPEDKGSGDRSLGLNPTSIAWLLHMLWGKLLNLSLSQSPHLCNGDNKSPITELLCRSR